MTERRVVARTREGDSGGEGRGGESRVEGFEEGEGRETCEGVDVELANEGGDLFVAEESGEEGQEGG